MSPIKISVCIPTFNRADLLDQTLQSVAAQKEIPFEVIVTDNNSTDKTDEVGHYYAKKYGFTYIKNKENLGMIGNWNKAISLAKGDYICLLHSDDLISPDWHEIWQDTIQNHKADFYTSAIAIIDADNKALNISHIYKRSISLKQPDVMKFFLKQLAPMIAPSGASIYSRKIFKEIGLYDPAYGTAADVPHWIQLVTKYSIYYQDSITFAWRSHAAQTFDKDVETKTEAAELKRIENYFTIISEFYKTKLSTHKDRELFIRTHVFITLALTNLHLAAGKLGKVARAHAIARRIFPDLFTSPGSYATYLSIQAKIVLFGLKRKLTPPTDLKELSWLKDIKKKTF